MFAENIELLIFSTPVRCLVVRGRVVDVNEDPIALCTCIAPAP
jgi:hypothetical protein